MEDEELEIETMEDLDMLDLTEPMFAVYFNVEGMSRQRAEEDVGIFIENFLNYSNIKFFIFPVRGSQETRIECLWQGVFAQNRENIEKILKQFTNIEDFGKQILSDKELTDGEKKKFIRQLKKYKLKNLTDEKSF